jgi:bacteriocin-like protein
MSESSKAFSEVSMEELNQIDGGNRIGIYTGDQSKLIALQKNGYTGPAPKLGGPDSYHGAGGLDGGSPWAV